MAKPGLPRRSFSEGGSAAGCALTPIIGHQPQQASRGWSYSVSSRTDLEASGRTSEGGWGGGGGGE